MSKEEKIKFNTQICTTKEQSKRLLKLGLDVDTSDLSWVAMKLWGDGVEIPEEERSYFLAKHNDDFFCGRYDVDCIPAWSLHRLIAMLPDRNRDWLTDYCDFKDCSKVYDEVVSLIEWMIENEYFNKEYLKEE
jgi:hypothetical protein